jgi:hypothetical protein
MSEIVVTTDNYHVFSDGVGYYDVHTKDGAYQCMFPIDRLDVVAEVAVPLQQALAKKAKAAASQTKNAATKGFRVKVEYHYYDEADRAAKWPNALCNPWLGTEEAGLFTTKAEAFEAADKIANLLENTPGYNVMAMRVFRVLRKTSQKSKPA